MKVVELPAATGDCAGADTVPPAPLIVVVTVYWPSRVKLTVLWLLLLAASVEVSTGFVPNAWLLPEQVIVPLASAGLGEQETLGKLFVVPCSTPVQVTVTGTPVAAEVGTALQFGTGGGVVSIVSGTVTWAESPCAVDVVSSGLLPMAEPVPVQVKEPFVVGFGEQVAPGMVLVVPTVAPLQLIVTVCEPPAGFGDAVQVGDAGGATTVNVTGTSIASSSAVNGFVGDVPLALMQT